MKRHLYLKSLLTFVILLMLATSNNCIAGGQPKISEQDAKAMLNRSAKLGFQENKGQMVNGEKLPANDVLFKAESPGLNIWVTKSGLTYQFFTKNDKLLTNPDGSPLMGADGKQKKEKGIRWHRQDMVLKNASIKTENVKTEGDITQGDVRYFLGHCEEGINHIRTFTKVIISDVYPGIDWVLYTSANGGLKHDFIVHPGANPNLIKLIYEGSGEINISNSKLEFSNELGHLAEGQLLCYQGNLNNLVLSKYKAHKNNMLLYSEAGNIGIENSKLIPTSSAVYSYEIGIELGDYDNTQDLIIDPELTWGTIYGGNAADGFVGMDIDDNGNVFIAGYAGSTDFPTQDIGTYYQGTLNGGYWDAIILKFDNSGTRLWVTFYGGSEGDQAFSVAIDQGGNVWVTGTTGSFDFPVQDAGTFFDATKEHTSVNIVDLFILKFDNNGNRLWGTFYGGFWDEWRPRITVDVFGNAWLTGSAEEYFPTFNGGGYFQGIAGGGMDAFILKFDNSCNLLLSTFYGGTSSDRGRGITTDPNGNVWLTGSTSSTDFPTQDAGTFFQGTYAGGVSDAYIVKFDNAGNRILSTYYGGSDLEDAYSIETDLNGVVWVLGGTSSTDFPTQNAGTFFQATNGGGGLWYAHDAFILQFDNLGNRQWATYYGGSEHEAYELESDNIAIDNCGNAYISWTTKSNDIFTYDAGSCHYYDGTYGGDLNDLFITKFDKDASLLWASYIGGSKRDFRSPLAVDNNNNFFMAGEFALYSSSSSSSLSLLDAGGSTYYDDSPGGNDDSFIFKFIQPAITVTQSQVDMISCVCDGSATVNISNCGIPPYSYVWSNGAQTIDTVGTTNTISGLCAGNYNVTVTSGCNLTEVVNFTITGPSGGTDATITPVGPYCTNDPSINFSAVDFGGVWSGTGIVDVVNGTFDPTSAGVGIHTITYTIPDPCGDIDSIYVEVTLGPNTGVDGAISLCSTTPTTDLFIQLGASASPGGIWSPILSSGTGVFNPAVDPAGTYTYTITNSCGTSSNDIIVSITANPVPGTNGVANLCVSGISYNLLDSLGGTPSVGGTWSPILTSGTGIIDPAIDAAGTYTYAVLDCFGVLQTADVIVTITTIPNTGISGAINFCSTDPAADLFNVLSGAPGFGGYWSPALISGSGIFDPAVDVAGIYTYTITNFCGLSSSDVVVTTATSPSPGTVGVAELCANAVSINLLDSLNGAPSNGGAWSPTLTSGTGVFDPAVDLAGTYTYSITLCGGGSASAVVSVTILALPNSGTSGTISFCSTDLASDLFNELNGTPNIAGIWSPALTSGSGLFDPGVDVAGTYTYTVVNSCGSSSSNVEVTVITCTLPTSGYVVSDDSICEGECVIFTDTSTGGSNWEWTFNGGTPSASNAQNPGTICFNVAGNYNIVQIVTSSFGIDTTSSSIQVFDTPIIDAGIDVSVEFGESTVLNATGAGLTGIYTWTPTTWLTCSVCPTTISTPEETITYTVIAVDSNGCSATDNVSVVVNYDYLIWVPNIFSPNGDGNNDVLVVRGKGVESIQFSVFDRWGEKVFETTNLSAGWDGTFRGQKMNKAVFVYYLKGVFVDGQEFTDKGDITLIR
ncbi:MAG: gliding motility-associated C-terminal domain-containing protein [Flavobacteriales bacterium]|nr:gliding motility-associated C-terminal domain-containing protein [Flavobacteriales bacterium]